MTRTGRRSTLATCAAYLVAAACATAAIMPAAAAAGKQHHHPASHRHQRAKPGKPKPRRGHEPAPKKATPAAAPALTAPQATVQFGLNMMGRLRGAGNLVFSPDSIEAALAMAGVGANGDTASQMASALALPGPSAFASVGALQGTLESEQATAGPPGDPNAPIFQIADGMFVAPGFALQDSFVSSLGSEFGATPQSVDFATPAGADAINAFVKQHTAGVIPQAVSPQDLDPQTLLALVNTLYFKGKWTSQFDPSASAPATFTAASGPQTVPFMNQTETLPYVQGSDYAVADLPYRSSTFSLMLVLPDPGVSVSTVANQLDGPTLDALAAGLRPQYVKLSMPRFHVAFSGSVIPQLQALGMIDAFGNADFTGITGANIGLYIELVQHTADFTVDEQGTVAAASTVVGTTAVSGFVAPPPIVFDANRPYLFFLRDNATGALLFAGQLSDAASAVAPPASS